MNLPRTSTLKQLIHMLVTATMFAPNIAFGFTQCDQDQDAGSSRCEQKIKSLFEDCKREDLKAETAATANSQTAQLNGSVPDGDDTLGDITGKNANEYAIAARVCEKVDCQKAKSDCSVTELKTKCSDRKADDVNCLVKKVAANSKTKDQSAEHKKTVVGKSSDTSTATGDGTTGVDGSSPAEPPKPGPIAGSGNDGAKPVPPPSDSGNTASQEKPSSALANGNMNKGMGNPMSALGPLMGLAAMMMGQNQGGPKPPQPQANGYASPDGVWDASGKPNCGATYAYRWTVCNNQLAQSCMKDLNTMIGSPVCQQFSARYCNMGYTPQLFYSACPFPAQAGQVCGNSYYTASAPVGQTMVDIVGEGLVGGTSGYCLRAAQINYCADAGNSSCPSCMALQSLTNPACANNPACNVSSSTQLVANQLAACPVPGQDPLVATGLIQNTGVPIAANPITLPVPINGGAPPAILPASAGGLKVASLAGRAPAARQQTFGDVAPEFGQNLFSAGSAPIDRRCQTASLNHCSR